MLKRTSFLSTSDVFQLVPVSPLVLTESSESGGQSSLREQKYVSKAILKGNKSTGSA